MQASDLYIICQVPTSASSSGIDLSTAPTQTQHVDAGCASRQNSTVWCLGIYATISLCVLLGVYASFGPGGTQTTSTNGNVLRRNGRETTRH